MTAVVPSFIKTKKQLKAHLEAGEKLILEDPTPWGWNRIELNYGETNLNVNGEDKMPGDSVYCTNHPKRSWFAQITIQPDNTLRIR